MCANSRPQQVRADRRRSGAPVPRASDKADNCHFSKSPTLSPRHSQRLVSMALVGDESLETQLCLVGKQKASMTLQPTLTLTCLVQGFSIISSVQTPACDPFSARTSEGQICPGS